MDTTERYTTLQQIHIYLLIGHVKAFVTRITDIAHDPDLSGLDRWAIMAGAAEGFKEVFAMSLEIIDKHNEVSR